MYIDCGLASDPSNLPDAIVMLIQKNNMPLASILCTAPYTRPVHCESTKKNYSWK